MRRMMGNHVLVKESIPFLGKGVDDVIAAVRVILTNNKLAQRLILEVGQPIILEKFVPKEEAPESFDRTVYDMTRNSPMQEYVISEGDKVPLQHLWEMVQIIQSEGYEVSHLLLGDKFSFQKWLKVTIPSTRMSFFNVPVQQMSEIDNDVFIVCGADPSSPDEVVFSVKAAIP